uniref:Vitellinogen beta-sheet shell domain-containing protein n=1 Tax=Sphaeramia orbicularis TaxID=375764 RepID=A0A673A5R6_9TELE
MLLTDKNSQYLKLAIKSRTVFVTFICSLIVQLRRLMVKEVSTADGVSIQAQNIANSILNLLQVKVKKTLNIYELYEDGTQGECKNLYVIPEEESRDRSSSISSSSRRSRSSSSSSSSSSDKSFDDPNVTILLKVVRADMKPQGYQITTYMDRSTTKLHMILADLAEDWMVRADVVPKIRWGEKCRGYNTTITAETGLVGQNPAARLKVDVMKFHPTYMQYRFGKMSNIPHRMNTRKFAAKHENSTNQISFTVVATSEKTINVIVKENVIKTTDVPIKPLQMTVNICFYVITLICG